jgi:hypothetical protein
MCLNKGYGTSSVELILVSGVLSSEFSEYRGDILFFHSTLVFLQSTGLGVPLLVILELALHLVEVHVEFVSESTSSTEVGVDASVEAASEAGTSFVLGVIEFFVEVRDILASKSTGFHAVLKHNASSCFLV